MGERKVRTKWRLIGLKKSRSKYVNFSSFRVCFVFWLGGSRVCIDIHETRRFRVSCSQLWWGTPIGAPHTAAESHLYTIHVFSSKQPGWRRSTIYPFTSHIYAHTHTHTQTVWFFHWSNKFSKKSNLIFLNI